MLISNVISCTQSSSIENENEKCDNENSETTEKTSTQNQVSFENCTESIQTISPSLTKPMSTSNSIPINLNKKRKLTPRNLFNIDTRVDRLEKIAAIASAPKVENPFEVFGKSVAVQLNQLPKRQALASQLKIQTILTEELLKHEESRESNNKQTQIHHDTYIHSSISSIKLRRRPIPFTI